MIVNTVSNITRDYLDKYRVTSDDASVPVGGVEGGMMGEGMVGPGVGMKKEEM